jgi:hypothetical protein
LHPEAKSDCGAKLWEEQRRMEKTMDQFTDAELAAMVRNSIYAKNTRFGDGDGTSKFLLVLAIPYGDDENCDTLPEAIEAFATFLQDYDWKERDFQVYQHMAGQQFFSASMEEVECEVSE